MASLGEELKYVSDNSDTWLGFAVWSVSQLAVRVSVKVTG